MKSKAKNAPRRHRPVNSGKALKSLAELAGDGRCIARKKVCGKCTYRYIKGDKRFQCPNCGDDRRCKNKAMEGATVCRLHGGLSPHAVRTKFFIARQIQEAYNNLIGNPDLLDLSFEIAAVTARTDELMGMLDASDSRAAAGEITSALGEFEDILATGIAEAKGNKMRIEVSRDAFRGAVLQLRAAIEPVNVERHVHAMLGDNYELTRRLNETERRWLVTNEAMVPIHNVLEVVVGLQRIMLKYILTPEDRFAFSQEVRREIPIDVIARAM